jgi:hypothetical protein
MFSKPLRYIILSGLGAVLVSTASAQIPLPPLPPGLEVHITTGRPPAVRHEMRPARPGPDYVWIGGYWADERGHWEWVPGRWERQAAPDSYWIPARYIRTGHGYIYEPGHWSTQQVIVNEEVRRRPEWRRHEREHERELERERRRENYRDRDDRDYDRDRDHR